MIFNCISKSQGRNREVGSEGSETANPRADEEESRIRPRIQMSEPKITKSTEEGFRVNAAAAGGKVGGLPGEISKAGGPSHRAALLAVTLGGSFEKSAEGIVATRLIVKARTQRGNAGHEICFATMNQLGSC
jgi:hypothetical protein